MMTQPAMTAMPQRHAGHPALLQLQLLCATKHADVHSRSAHVTEWCCIASSYSGSTNLGSEQLALSCAPTS